MRKSENSRLLSQTDVPLNASEGLEAVVSFISRAIENAGKPDGFVHTGTVANQFSELSNKLHSFQTSRALFGSAAGAKLIADAQNALFDLIEQEEADDHGHSA